MWRDVSGTVGGGGNGGSNRSNGSRIVVSSDTYCTISIICLFFFEKKNLDKLRKN